MSSISNMDGLKDRDKQIIILSSQGLLGTEIAVELKLNIMTMKRYLYMLYKREGIRDGHKMVQLVLKYMNPQPKVDGGRVYFTSKEIELLDLTSRGCSNKQIAQVMDIAVGTAKHIAKITYRKTGAENRSMLAIWWKEHGHEAKAYSQNCRQEIEPDHYRSIHTVTGGYNAAVAGNYSM